MEVNEFLMQLHQIVESHWDCGQETGCSAASDLEDLLAIFEKVKNG